MANSWCLDPATQTFDDIDKVIAEFEGKLEQTHNNITNEEWARLATAGNFETYHPDVKTKPDWSKYYGYDYTYTDDDYYFGDVRDALGVDVANALYDPNPRRTSARDKATIGGKLFGDYKGSVEQIQSGKKEIVESFKKQSKSVSDKILRNRGLPTVVSIVPTTNEVNFNQMYAILIDLQSEKWHKSLGPDTTINQTGGQLIAAKDFLDQQVKNLEALADLSETDLAAAGGWPAGTLRGFAKDIKEISNLVNDNFILLSEITKLTQALSDGCTINFETLWKEETRKLGHVNEIEEFLAGTPGAALGPGFRFYGSSGGPSGATRAAAAASSIEAALEAAFADNIIFREQCFLLANLADLVEMKKAEGELPLPYIYPASGSATTPPAGGSPPTSAFDTIQNHPIHVQGTAFAFMNKLAVHPSQKYLFDVNEADLSKLTPRARFFKVEKDQNGKDYETEIEFDTNVTRDLESYMTRGGRGLGVGVRSFSFDYDGTDPFSAKKAISAKLVIRASSFSDLLRDRKSRKGNPYKYVDLALKTGTYFDEDKDFSDIEKENLNKLNFRLRVLVEWTSEKGTLSRLGTAAKDALYNSAISIYLTPTIHEFDFDETGALDFTINYLAYVEDFFSTSNFDVFGSVTAEKTARDLTMDFFRREDCDVSKDPEFAKFREQDETYVSTLNQAALSKIIQGLRVRKKIKYLNVTREEIRKWLTNPRDNSYVKNVFNSPPVTLDEDIVSTALTAAKAAAKKNKKDDPDEGMFRLALIANSNAKPGVAFFYLSDLLSVVMNNIETAFEKAKTPSDSGYFDAVVTQGDHRFVKDIRMYIQGHVKDSKLVVNSFEEEFKRTRVVLGPMEVTPYGKTKTEALAVSCTLGDIPIGLNYFLDFMSAKVLGKDFIQYPFSKFIKEIITDCIKNYINSDSCFGTNASQKVSLNSSAIMAYNTFDEKESEAGDQLTHVILESMKDDSGKAIKNCLLIDNFIGTEDLNSGLLPILKISGPRDTRSDLDIEKARNYYVFTIGKRYPVDAYTGSPATDAQNGIFHYVLGADKGIVRNISLDKTNTPGLKEVRFEQEGYAGLEQLREVYNANISTFLNPQTFPGTYIYVEPKGFDPTALQDLTRFGIGGYYMITKTSHKIEPGNNETSIYAQWVSSKGGDPVKNEGEKREVTEGTEKQKKCKVESLVSTGKTR